MEQRKRPIPSSETHRWSSRPYLSGLLRLFIFLFPTVVSLAAAVVMARYLPSPTGGLSTVSWWAAILGTSFAFLFIVQRVVRRLTPLATLLKLTLTFPDRAPSRYRLARRTGNLAELRARLRRAGESDDREGLQQAAETILALAAALSSHDRQTRGHSERVRVFTDMLAHELKLPAPERDRLRWAALLHDIGKLEVPAEILNKTEPLDVAEWRVVRGHPRMGMELIGPLAAWLGPQAKTIQDHHERYDGDGYPSGVQGEEISLGGRIVAVADAYDTMTAARPYRESLSAAAAREELSRCAGKQFDPDVVRAMMDISLGRLWWRVGILAWLAQIPLLGPASRFMGRPLQAAAGTAGAAAAATVIAVSGITVPLVDDGPVHVAETQHFAQAQPQETLPPPEREPRAREARPGETRDAPSDPAVPQPIETVASGDGESSGNDNSEGDQDGGGEDPGGGGNGGGGGGDPGLLRQVVQTVRDVVDDLPAL
jgi:hypothetical protein